MIQILLVLSLVQGLFADDKFQPLRDDHNVPSSCVDMNAGLFSIDTLTFTYGRKGAVKSGFTFEYPVDRRDATLLWDYFKSHAKGQPNLSLYRKIKQNPELLRDHDVILANYQEMGVDFGNEGDVLEVLATFDLRNLFPEPAYFITGGIEYRKSAGDRTLGEIDIMVGMRDTCDVVYLGEVKLGTGRALSKAYRQLQRFSDFIDSETGHPLGDFLDPSVDLDDVVAAKVSSR